MNIRIYTHELRINNWTIIYPLMDYLIMDYSINGYCEKMICYIHIPCTHFDIYL